MKNMEIRQKAKSSGVKLWQIAEALGMTDSAFSRKLRHEFSDDTKARVYEIINDIATMEEGAT